MGIDEDAAEMDALLIEAEVKEDFLDLGLISDEDQPPAEVAGRTLEEKSEDAKVGGLSSFGKKYKIKVVEPQGEFCLKYIGSGASFCLRKECVTNHGGAGGGGLLAFDPPRGGVLAILKSPQVAFASPTLRLSSVELEVVEMWENQSFSLEDWQQMFSASNQGEGIVMSAHDIKQEVKASRNPASFRTPAKKKKVFIAEPDVAFEGYARTFESSQEQSAYKKSATSARLADSVVELDRSLSSLSKGVERMFLGSAMATRDVEATADMGFRKAAGVENLIGSSDVMDESEFACPTIWGTLATLGTELTTIRDLKATPLPVVDLGPLRSEIKTSQATLGATVTKLGSFTRLFAKSVLKRVSGMEEEMKKQARGSLKAGGVEFGDELDSLLHDAGHQSAPARTKTLGRSEDRRISELEDKLNQVLQSNEDLERRFAQIIAESEVDAVKFAGLGLRSVEEVSAWVAIHFPKRAYGLIMDAYLLFDLVADEGPTNQKDLMTEMKRRDELDIATEAESQALTAFLFEVPRLFHSSSVSLSLTAENVSHFSKVPTHKSWANQGGLKKTIEKKLAKLKASLREVMATELTPGTLAYGVAVEALEKTISWVGAFNTYIDTTYEHLHVEVGFNSARAWSLTTQLGARIFSDLHSVRVGTTKAMGKGPESICPVILWSVFRTHDKMAGFENANFEDHPSIASEFIKFLATNTGIEGMSSLQEDVAGMKLKLKDVDRQATLASAKADKATSVADVAKKSAESFARKISSLEAKVG
jgi:hypothetical protein